MFVIVDYQSAPEVHELEHVHQMRVAHHSFAQVLGRNEVLVQLEVLQEDCVVGLGGILVEGGQNFAILLQLAVGFVGIFEHAKVQALQGLLLVDDLEQKLEIVVLVPVQGVVQFEIEGILDNALQVVHVLL